MSNLYDIGRTGLQSYRQSLAITGQNIANVNTEGYKRRGADLEELAAKKGSSLDVGMNSGMGVRVAQMRRAFDEFLLNKARSATSFAASSSAYVTAAKQIENIMLPGEANLGNSIGKLFESFQQVSSDPGNLSGRLVALEQAKQLSDTFQQLSSLLNEMKVGQVTQADYLLDEVNLLTNELDRINTQLATGSQIKVNNSLLDARDLVIDKINEYVEVHTELDDRGLAKLTLGDGANGPVLVSTEGAVKLGAIEAQGKLNLILSPGVENILTSRITGGAIHGLSTSYMTAVDMLHEVDTIAFTMVRDINAIHNQGLNFEGKPGGDFFKSLSLDLYPMATNLGSASATVDIIDPAAIELGTVTFTYDGTADQWTGIAPDGSAVVSGRNKVAFRGVEITFSGSGTTFDQFIFDPVAGSARGVTVALVRPEDIAAASPLMVSENPGNKSAVVIDALPAAATATSSLPLIKDVFNNGFSAIGATEFLTGGSVARIPPEVSKIDLISLARQSQAQFGLSAADLGNAGVITLNYSTAQSNGSILSDTVTFDVDFQAVNGYSGVWTDASQIAELLNRGIVAGTIASSGASTTLAAMGGYCSGASRSLNFSHSEANFTSASVSVSTGGSLAGVTSSRVAPATNVQIFTREGRHIAGTTPDNATITAYQTAMTADNGFNVGASYVGDYLNLSGDAGYLGMTVKTRDETDMVTKVIEGTGQTQAKFGVIDGVDTNEESINGLSSVAQTANYQMSIAIPSVTWTKSLNASELENPTNGSVAAAMIEKFRVDAPIASIVGNAATPNAGDSLALTFEGKSYTLTVNGDEAVVSGGEPGRLFAFFDADKRLHVVSSSGTIGRSVIDVVVDNANADNVNVAQRLGLMDGLTKVSTRFSDDFHHVEGTGTSGVNNIVTLNFSGDDTYNLGFIFDEKPNSGSSAAADKEISISAAMSGGDASAIAAAINTAIAANASEAGGGASLSGIASASANGSVVTLTVTDGKSVEILRSGSTLSAGDGTVVVTPVTKGATAKTLKEPYVSPGFDLTLEDNIITAMAASGSSEPTFTLSGSSLADQYLKLEDLPEEELIVFLGDSGPRRLTMAFDETPLTTPAIQRDLEIRVKDVASKTLEIIDVETQTSVATRTLNSDDEVTAAGFIFKFNGALDADDKFSVVSNARGTGDNRNLLAILGLQLGPSSAGTSGGFQKMYNNAIARLGSLVQSGNLAQEAAIALKEASIEAEATYSGVNLDTEAANLIQQQQAYQASARILSTARELFETLLQTM
jgi:flagellar hook-associated protein FlgK